MNKPKIYVRIVPAPSVWEPDAVGAYAVAEDGVLLAYHLSSSASWALWDTGVTNPRSHKHEFYRAHYPDGYDLVEGEPPPEVMARYQKIEEAP